MLRQCHHVGRTSPEICAEIVDAQCFLTQPGKQRVAGRSADRLHAICPREARPSRGQPIDIGRSRQRITITAQGRFQIIDGNEEDVWLARIGGMAERIVSPMVLTRSRMRQSVVMPKTLNDVRYRSEREQSICLSR
jgi:hypothetical protein